MMLADCRRIGLRPISLGKRNIYLSQGRTRPTTEQTIGLDGTDNILLAPLFTALGARLFLVSLVCVAIAAYLLLCTYHVLNKGLATLCIGGGMGIALTVER